MNDTERSITKRNTSTQIPPDLRDFSSLPNEAFVRQPIVQRLLCCSAATVWRRVADKSIPAPRKISDRISGWNVGELREALAKKMEAKS